MPRGALPCRVARQQNALRIVPTVGVFCCFKKKACTCADFMVVLAMCRGVAARSWCRRRGDAGLCCASAHISDHAMQWLSIGAAAILMLANGTAIQKSFLVPFVALQAPSTVISWIKGDYGQWTTFLALLVRLMYFIPGKLELPLSTLLFVSVAPYQLLNMRGTRDSAILSLAIAAYLAIQHFTRAGGVRRAFDSRTIVATFSIICITLFSLNFLEGMVLLSYFLRYLE